MIAAALAAAALTAVAFVVMAVKDRTYVASPPYAPSGEANCGVAVVYYSRSGHSEAVAREIARTFNAPIARIQADYSLDFSGQAKAVANAKERVLPRITVEPIDLAPARRVYLVSPTWLFRPAAPLWAYMEEADLSGKDVVLVMTGNSRYEQEESMWGTPAESSAETMRPRNRPGSLTRSRLSCPGTRDERHRPRRGGPPGLGRPRRRRSRGAAGGSLRARAHAPPRSARPRARSSWPATSAGSHEAGTRRLPGSCRAVASSSLIGGRKPALSWRNDRRNSSFSGLPRGADRIRTDV